MSGSYRESLSDVGSGWEALPDVQELAGVPHGCPRVGGRPSRVSESVREVLTDVREWSRGPPGCPAVVGRPSQLSGSGGWPSRISGCGRETLPNVQE